MFNATKMKNANLHDVKASAAQSSRDKTVSYRHRPASKNLEALILAEVSPAKLLTANVCDV